MSSLLFGSVNTSFVCFGCSSVSDEASFAEYDSYTSNSLFNFKHSIPLIETRCISLGSFL